MLLPSSRVCTCPQKAGERVGASGTGVAEVVSHQAPVLGTELGTVEEQQAFLPTNQHSSPIFKKD